MTVLVLRPEPGNAATLARLRAAGVQGIAAPLFAVEPLPWTPPDPAAFDALLLTSANAARMAGRGLSALVALPVIAVGTATGKAAREAGLNVVAVGNADGASAAALALDAGYSRMLHLAGRDRRGDADRAAALVIPVYASVALHPPVTLRDPPPGAIAMVHSPRAGTRLARMTPDRARMAIVAISANAARACGDGWRSVAIAPTPDDAAMVATVLGSIDRDAIGRDKVA